MKKTIISAQTVYGLEDILPKTTADVVYMDDSMAKTVQTTVSELQSHASNKSNPHGVTKANVGLGSVDNTADAGKSVASAAKLTTARTIALSGGVTGSGTFDGSGNLTIAATQVANQSNQKVGVGKNGGAVTGTRKAINLVEGSNISMTVADDSTNDRVNVTVAATAATYTEATSTKAGLMSAGDKAKLDAVTPGTTIYTHPVGDGNLHVPATGTTNNGKVLKAGATLSSAAWGTLAKADVGLGNVDNTADSAKNVASAAKMTTARTIALTGGATGAATSFDGTANISIPVTALDVSKATAGTLPISRGGTGATTDNAARANLTVKSGLSDTKTNWDLDGVTVQFCYPGSTISGAPSDYGLLLNTAVGTEVHQLWMTQSNGRIYHRGGNAGGWHSAWTRMLDSALDVYPVGSLYMSVNATNPASLFGGSWVLWGPGRVPVCVDTSQAEFNASQKYGGAKTHTLTVAEMPSHGHLYSHMSPGTQSNWGPMNCVQQKGDNKSTVDWEGGSGAHNNLQPYITCYIWRRDA